MSNDRYLWGLDISLKNTGIAVYNLDKKEFVLIDSFSTEKIYATRKYKGYNLHGLKLKNISDWIEGIYEKYPPSLVSIERGFSRYNNETQAIFKTFGVIQRLLWNKPQELYPPKEVKAFIVHGSATKEDVANAILSNAKYNDLSFRNEDESDAVAVAITYLIDRELLEWEKPKWSEIKKLRKVDEK